MVLTTNVMSMFKVFIFFFKQKTAYEMRISDWSSDVCSSDLARTLCHGQGQARDRGFGRTGPAHGYGAARRWRTERGPCRGTRHRRYCGREAQRSEEHTSELQSLMRTSYAVFSLQKNTHHTITPCATCAVFSTTPLSYVYNIKRSNHYHN